MTTKVNWHSLALNVETLKMLTIDQAHDMLAARLGQSPKTMHCLFVAHAMAGLARLLAEDEYLWRIVGLCHDLDDNETSTDRKRHGLLTAEWLADDLPADALRAIEAHDHRTGVTSDTTLAAALKLADALAVVDQRLGREATCLSLARSDEARLRELCAARPHLVDILVATSNKLGVASPDLGRICRAAPAQSSSP